MNPPRLLVPIALLSIPAAVTLHAEPDPPQDVEKKALAILAADVGTWDCRWERLDAAGKVVSTFEGTETFEYAFEPRVLRLTTHVPSQKSRSTGLKFFDPIQKKIRFVNVGQDGDFWDMEEDIKTLQVRSMPHKNANGSVMSIRFSVVEKTKDKRRVLMEYTLDGGKTWTKGSYQTLERRKPGKPGKRR